MLPAPQVRGFSVSADGRDVVVAWFTAADDQPRVQAVLSSDGGATFGPPVRIDDGQPIGRVDTASVPGEGSMVSFTRPSVLAWTEAGKPSRIRTARVVTR